MQRLVTYIGFAIKSNSIIKGLDEISKTKKRQFVLLVAEDISQNSKEKIQNISNNKNIPLVTVDKDLFLQLNLVGVKILGITDPNLAKAILAVNEK